VDLVRRVRVGVLLNHIECDGSAFEIEKGATMTRFLPLAAVAGALACVVAIGSAQAAPASGNILGKLTTASDAGSSVEKAGYRHHRRYHHRKWWKKRYYKRHRHHHRHWN
jgi:hypothetical protein